MFGGHELVLFDVVDFQQPSFYAVPQVTVDFFGVKMQAAMVKLVNVFWCFLEHAQKLEGFKQVTVSRAFRWSTTQIFSPTNNGGSSVFSRFLTCLIQRKSGEKRLLCKNHSGENWFFG